jgi:hypothetical protein
MLGIFELHVKKAFYSTLASLVAKIKDVKEGISNLDRDNVAKAYRCFQKRIEVVEANDHFLEFVE